MRLIMKKLSLPFTILIIAFAFNACGADEAEKLYGSWKYGYDIYFTFCSCLAVNKNGWK